MIALTLHFLLYLFPFLHIARLQHAVFLNDFSCITFPINGTMKQRNKLYRKRSNSA